MFEDCVVLRSYRKWQRIYRHELHASVNNSRDSSFYALSCVHAVEEMRPKLAPNMVMMKLVIVLLITSADAKRKHKGRKDDDHEDENRGPVFLRTLIIIIMIVAVLPTHLMHGSIQYCVCLWVCLFSYDMFHPVVLSCQLDI